MTLTKKLVVFGIALTIIPLMLVGLVSWRVGQQATAAAEAQDGTVQLARADLDHIVRMTYVAAEGMQHMAAANGETAPAPADIERLLNALKDLKVGRTGYIYVLQASGPKRGAYVLSLNRKRDGEVLWDAKDADGRLFIQTIISQALAQGPADFGEIRYPWKNANDPTPVMKLVRFKYFPAWDWVIGAGIPEPELFATAKAVEELNHSATTMVFAVMLIALVVTSAAWLVFGRRLTGKLGPMAGVLSDGAHHMATASSHVATSAQSLSHGATQQAASLQETSASVEELTSITKRNSTAVHQAATLITGVSRQVELSDAALNGLVTSMGQIQESSQRVAKIIKTIDEIAFQTNILALNAAVEAARAGEAGMGFAVVAGEVRNLAQRSSAAAHDTATLIEESISRAQAGAQRVNEVEAAISGITGSVASVRTLVESISASSSQQADGLGQVSHAIGQISAVTQSTAAMAEESAAASEELAAQAETTMATVDELARIIGATSAPVAAPPIVAESGRRTLARAAVWAAMMCGVSATAWAQAPIQLKTEDGATTLKVGALVQAMVNRDATTTTSVTDLYMRRIRLVAGGQIKRRLKFFVESDTPYLGRKAGVWQAPETIVQDAFVTYDIRPNVQVDAGLMLVPNSYNSTQSAAALLPIGYGPYSFLASAPTYSRVGRDQGVQVRGYLAGGHLEVRAGAFRGLSRVQPSAAPRYAGRVVWYPFASQTGFFYAGTLNGAKRMVAIGASIDRENSYRAYGADIFVEWPLPTGVLTGQAGLLRFDGGRTFGQLPLQNTWLLEAGYSVPGRRVGVFAQAARQDIRAVAAADASSVVGGVTLWLRPGVANVKVGVGRTAKTGAPSHTQVSAQFQIWLY